MKVGCAGLDMFGEVVAKGHNHALGVAAPVGPVTADAFWGNREERRNFMIHAEQDMVSKTLEELHYVVITLFPCVSCMNLLAVAGCKVLIYADIYDKDKKAIEVAKFHNIELIHVTESGLIHT
jgi:deoxycytidylate deaminase